MKVDLWREYGLTPATLSSGGVSLIDIAELVDALPDGCAYKREIGGYWAWTDDQKFLVAQEYQLRIANWMQSRDGSKGRNRPKPLEVPKGRYQEEQEALAKEAKYADKVDRFNEREAARQARFEELDNNTNEA